jgi:hypothetical protein
MRKWSSHISKQIVTDHGFLPSRKLPFRCVDLNSDVAVLSNEDDEQVVEAAATGEPVEAVVTEPVEAEASAPADVAAILAVEVASTRKRKC